MRPQSKVVTGRGRARKGFALPFIVLLIVVFVGITAIAIDISRMFVIRNELQTAADAGALAGAMQLASDMDRAAGYDSALAYAQRNNLVEHAQPNVGEGDIVPGAYHAGTFTPTGSWTDPGTRAVMVTTHHLGNYILGSVYSVFSHPMSATGVAMIGSVIDATCVRPLAFSYERLLSVLHPGVPYDSSYELSDEDVAILRAATSAQEITLKRGASTDADNPGNFYAQTEPPVYDATTGITDPHLMFGEKDYEQLLSPGCGNASPIHVGAGDWLVGFNGAMPNAIRNALSPQCTVNLGGGVMGCSPPVEWLIPLWDYYSPTLPGGGGGTFYHVKYIGVFKVTRYEAGGGGNVWGYFSALNTTGVFDEHPGPVTMVALVR